MSLFHNFNHFRQEVDNMFREFDRQFYGASPFNDRWFNEGFFNTPALTSGMEKENINQSSGYEKNNQLQTSGQNTSSGDQRVSNQQPPRSGWLSSFGGALTPVRAKVDVIEEKDKYIVHAELPGIQKNDIKLDLNGNYLTLSAERKSEINEEDKDKKWIRKESSYGSVSRTLCIPEDVDLTKIEAKHENGVLNVTLPRMEMKKEEKKNSIKIQ